MSILIFIFSLAILILVHEFGHFIVAKKSGIRVDEFGLGFPPKLWSKKWGGTLYTLNALPFGGFVKIFGEDAHLPMSDIGQNEKAVSFQYKPKWIQALVLVSGVMMNVIFAWFLISLGFMIGLPTPVEHDGFGAVTDAYVIVVDVLPLSPAEKAGLQMGDKILSVKSESDVLQGPDLTKANAQQFIRESKSKTIDITYSRGKASPATITIEPNADIVPNGQAIGIAMDDIGILKLPAHLAFIEGARTTGFLIKATAFGLGTFFGNAITLHADFSQVSGPIGIASVVGEATSLGFVYLLSLVALISINLAIINLLPFPALDGGRLLFVLIEAIIRQPIPTKIVQWTNMVGFAVLILLMIVVTGHDILKLV